MVRVHSSRLSPLPFRRGFFVPRCGVFIISLSQKAPFSYNDCVIKKTVLILLLFLPALSLGASVFPLPSYDFTFYATADETLTSFTKENVGIDITGYGFVGSSSARGIYIRIGIQTPFDTLLKIKDSLFSSSKNSQTKDSGSGIAPGETTSPDTVPPETPATPGTAEAAAGGALNEAAVVTPAVSEDETTFDGAPIEIETSASAESTLRKKETAVNPSKWKFLLTAGPAWRSMLNDNAMVYAGLGLSVSTEYINDFTYENGDYYSSFSALLGADMDAGFRIGLSNSSTTIRIGVHFIIDFLGFSQLKIYDRNHLEISTENAVYGYIAGKKGIAAATTGRGYIRLAKTINEKRRVRYNYSNTTDNVGAGRVVTIVL